MTRYLSILFVFVASAAALRAAPPDGQKPLDFTRDVRPILVDACFACHGPDEKQRKGNLRLDTMDGAFGKGKAGPIIVAGKSDDSALVHRITADVGRMPPAKATRKLSPTEIETLRRWIDEGATYSAHWAYLAPKRPELPAVKDGAWGKNAIDRFVLARLEREGLKPSPEAAKETLLRRVTLDLTGLPPTLAEIDAFLADKSPMAYEKVVERLLASPRYGEHMVASWLDAARYADSNGYQQDRTRIMWPWRDWVIQALNDNMPYDRFVTEQLAGDLLPNATRSQRIATGFNRNHMLNGEGGRVAEESRIDYVVDRTDTMATVFLGLPLGCARCHDHKYDPFTQKEYYQLFAYFNNVPESGAVDRGGNAVPVLPVPTPEQEKKLAALHLALTAAENALQAAPAKPNMTADEMQRAALAAYLQLPPVGIAVMSLPLKNHRTAAQRHGLVKKRDDARKALDDFKKTIVEVMVMEERPQVRETALLIRGAWDKPGDKVKPGVPAALPSLPTNAPPNRLGLARWLADPAHPLTARVAVNRAWQTHFGNGLVVTSEDFGVQGQAPSHPELLDWLATEFVRTGWDVKTLHRLIVTSATYRQSSRMTKEMRERDPDNVLLARGPRGRLPSHVIRDQALMLSGLLVEKVGGPPVKPYQPPGIWEEFSFGKIKYEQDKGDKLYRRSVYVFWRRTNSPTTMFDTATRQVCTVRLPRTNTPLQSLILLNDTAYVEAARVFGDRILTQGGKSMGERIEYAFRLATTRKPTDAEWQILERALARLQKQYQADPEAARKLLKVGEAPVNPKLDVAELAAYTGLASLILNLDETISTD